MMWSAAERVVFSSGPGNSRRKRSSPYQIPSLRSRARQRGYLSKDVMTQVFIPVRPWHPPQG